MEELGSRVREARDQKLWTQRELSEASGVMEATISRIENMRHRRRPTNATLKALANALDVSVRWLALGDEQGKAPARSDRAGAQTPDTGSYPVKDPFIVLGGVA